MRVRVTALRKNGLRLTRTQWPKPVVGLLKMQVLDPAKTGYKLASRCLELWDVGLQSRRLALPPIGDPELVGVAEGGVLLAGTELDYVAGEMREHRQVWLCVPY